MAEDAGTRCVFQLVTPELKVDGPERSSFSMDRTDSSAAMASLATYAESESDDEEKVNVEEPKTAVDSISDEEHDTPTPNPSQTSRPSSRPALEDDNSRSGNDSAEAKKTAKKKTTRLVSYGADELDEDEDEDLSSPPSSAGEHGTGYVEGKVMSSSLNVEQASSLSRSMLNKSVDEVELPPEPPNKCPRHLQEKIARLHERRRVEGLNLNDTIQRRVDFRNPSIYEKLIEYCGIDEKGTNYPPELFDPLIWGKESFYDALDKAQKADMERREKERKERTKVEFVVGTKKSGSKTEISSSISSGKPDEKKRKTKWDTEPSQAQAGRIADSFHKNSAANLTTLATGTKSTVIPATGNIVKKPSK